ncbi:ShlB/FhaC/HecB family hemolysin secretion/activation protein [Noviherbaspirillum galbum]|uniref:ShlB/FhaC/HecB family hemolysin secretion/activation protein n=1 Tax=Noviherbaspirillum galbum TaxID=2709383 RepID=A0A6B3SNT6_9BURK|nr:ShlB/FhaC/HecB family hemolysin secretion/activation protein [Noviherbaspirillum galbum]NEX60945.1 ShlB/FhaC/HecB family hemolysin secretion/activation protein [Noviherbaspirillum galbum]
MRREYQMGLAAGLLAASAAHVTAQTVPDAGSLLQQIEQNRPIPLPGKSERVLAPLPAPMTALPGPTATVAAFRFAGNTLLSDAELGPSVASFLNRPLSFGELQNAAIAVATRYREAGWVVRAYLPAQEVKDGIVLIQVVEAKFGGLRLEEKARSPISSAQLEAIVEANQPKGAPLNANALDRALLLMEDLPGLAPNASLAQGRNEYETDLVLSPGAARPFRGEAAADNTGSPSTGRAHLNATLAWANPLGRGDSETLAYMHSSGSDYLRAAASLPVGPRGWRIGASLSYLQYKLVSDAFAALDVHGNSFTAGLDASYPLIRSRLSNLYLSLNADHKQFDNNAAGLTVTKYKIDSLSVALTGNRYDGLGLGGASTVSVALVAGKVDLDGSPNRSADAAGPNTAGSYAKLKYNLSRTQAVSERITLSGQFSGQFGNKNLDSSERFYLGGASGVRAYPGSEGGGSDGQMLILEARARLPHDFTLIGFYDWGHVTVNRNNDFIGAAAVNSLTLKGAGVSLAWTNAQGMSVRGTLARRIGSNPVPTADGNDSDGTLVKNRLWLSASVPF